MTRLGAMFAGPLLACVAAGQPLTHRRRQLLVAAAIGAAAWQWWAPAREVAISVGDRSMQGAYYHGLRDELRRLQRAGGPGRLEVPFTRGHWEAVHLAPIVPLARGWETQLDRKYDGLFYKGHLTAARYQRWLRRTAVRWVAIPDAPSDPSGRAEARLVRAGLPYLHQVWADAHWRLYAVDGATPLVSGPATLTALHRDGFTLDVRGTGAVTVRVRSTPYFKAVRGSACIAPSGTGWTRVRARRPGVVRVRAVFSPGRMISRGGHCGAGRT
jgi:hypothetical protein